MLKKTINIFLAILLTIGLFNFDAIKLQVKCDDVILYDDKSFDTAGGILPGWDNGIGLLPNEICYKKFTPKEKQLCVLMLDVEGLEDVSITIYNNNRKQIYKNDNLSKEKSYIYSKTNTKVIYLSFILNQPIYIKFTNKRDYFAGVDFSIFTYPPFKDVKVYEWYFDTIMEAYDKGLMTGVSNDKYAPDAKMTRGMVATVLYRMAGAPNVKYAKKFSDVKKSDFFAIATTWASNNKVIKGYGNGKFGANDSITREQMAAMCYNYVKLKLGKVPNITSLNKFNNSSINIYDITEFKDYNKITKNMRTCVQWAVSAGIMQGNNWKLNPTGKATRAECAKMLLLVSKIVK